MFGSLPGVPEKQAAGRSAMLPSVQGIPKVPPQQCRAEASRPGSGRSTGGDDLGNRNLKMIRAASSLSAMSAFQGQSFQVSIPRDPFSELSLPQGLTQIYRHHEALPHPRNAPRVADPRQPVHPPGLIGISLDKARHSRHACPSRAAPRALDAQMDQAEQGARARGAANADRAGAEESAGGA
jgi:hypothetical protein